MTLVYASHWLVLAGLLAFSWSRARRLLHPHFLFTAMLVVLHSDFLIRGYDDRNLVGIFPEVLTSYQIATLIATSCIILITALVHRPYEVALVRLGAEAGGGMPERSANRSQSHAATIFWGAMLIILIEVAKRLYATGFDVYDIVVQMLGPRGVRDWDVDSAAADNALFQLVRAVLPFSAVALAYLMVTARGAIRVASFLAFTAVMFILVTDGSRTPVVMGLAALPLFQIALGSGGLRKAVTLVVSGGAIALLTSLMYRFRSAGFLADATVRETLVYHQDDSIYRAWFAYHVGDGASYRWNPLEFYYTVAALPIPRAIWPGKPLLDADFYGDYKLSYVTNTFFGESVAMFGGVVGTAWAVLTAVLIYRAFYSAQRLLTHSFGLVAYLLVALYVYMCLRSTMNLTTFVYLPAVAILAVLLVERAQRGPSSGGRAHHIRRYRPDGSWQ